jgi:hypothetical protein
MTLPQPDLKRRSTYRLRPRPRRRWRVLGALLLVLIAGHAGWTAFARRQLTRQIEAIRLRGEPIAPADFFQSDRSLPDTENAAIDLRRAAAAIHPDLPAWRRLNDMGARPEQYLRPGLPPDQQALVREIMQAESEALRLASDAARKPRMHFAVSPASPMILTPLPDLNGQHHLADLLQLAAVGEFEGGDHEAALQWVALLLRIANALEEQPFYVAHRVSLDIASAAARTLADLTPRVAVGAHSAEDASVAQPVTAGQVAALIAALLDERAIRAGQLLEIRAHRAELADAMVALADGRGIHLRDVLVMCPNGSEYREWRFTRPLLKPWVLSDAALVCRLNTGMVAAAAEDTWPGFMAKAPDMDGAMWGRWPVHPFAQIMERDYRWTVERHHLTLARRRMAALALALRWHAVDHDGDLPSSLEDLVPAYLAAVPTDPFASGGRALAYQPGATRPIVYSVGHNGVDDGGSELRPPRYSMTSTPGDPADVVVHLDVRVAGVAPVDRWTLVKLGRVRLTGPPRRQDGSIIHPAIRLPP